MLEPPPAGTDDGRMRNLVVSVLMLAVVCASAPRARADSCYSNSQCPAGYVCWGGQCQPGGSNGQTPSSSRGGSPNLLVVALGLVVIVGVIYWLRPGGPASSAAETTPATRALPPDSGSCTAAASAKPQGHSLALTLAF